MTLCCYCKCVMERHWPIANVSHGACPQCLRKELAKVEDDARKARSGWAPDHLDAVVR